MLLTVDFEMIVLHEEDELRAVFRRDLHFIRDRLLITRQDLAFRRILHLHATRLRLSHQHLRELPATISIRDFAFTNH